MAEFSLSRRENELFPVYVEAEGVKYQVNADFRTVLKILRVLTDPEIRESDRLMFAVSWFYKEDMPPEPTEHMFAFVCGERSESRGEEQQFCFEFDAPEIYASFLMQYGIDLVSVPYLHWMKFKILLTGLGEDTPFRAKIRLRFLDTKGCRDRQKAETAKQAVQIPQRHSRTETAFQQELTEALLRGEDISRLIDRG